MAKTGRTGSGRRRAHQHDPADTGTRGRIVRVALELFAARGFEGTGISEIAARVGIAKSVIYHHFDGKDAVLEEIARNTIAEAVGLKREIAARFAESRTGDRDLKGLVATLVSFVLANRDAVTVMLRESLRAGSQPPLFAFWEANLEAGRDVARDLRIDLATDDAQQMLFEAFFMLVLPIIGFAVLGGPWGARFGVSPKLLRGRFEKAFQVNLEEFWFHRFPADAPGRPHRARRIGRT